MSGVNKVIIIGRLGQDPEVRAVGSGNTVTKLRVATSENWVDKEGRKQEKTEWHSIVAWGRLAEICGKHLAKGRQVYIEGRLQTRPWEDQQGQKRYTTEIVANTVQFLGSAGDSVGRNSGRSNEAPSAGGSDDFAGHNFGPEPAFDSNEDIPF